MDHKTHTSRPDSTFGIRPVSMETGTTLRSALDLCIETET